MEASPLITSQTIAALNPGLVKFAQRLLYRREDAEDLVQETWYSAIRTSANYQARGSLKAWLRGIMRRRFQDRLRRERLAELLDEERHGACPAGSPEQLDWTRAAVHTSAALAHLTDLERNAVLLCDAHDLDRDEVAGRLNISRGYLRVILHRARGKLAQTLRTQGEELDLCA